MIALLFDALQPREDDMRSPDDLNGTDVQPGEQPSCWRRLMFKVPVALYYDGPAEIWRRRCVMLLTTKGRLSGQPHFGGVSFMPLDVVFSGWVGQTSPRSG